MSRPFYFTVIFWGTEHRGHFLDLLVASLLAPGNLPALRNRQGSRFLICTTAEDWAALQVEPNFLRLGSLIQLEHIEIPRPASGENKMFVMSRGHALMSERAFDAKALGVFVTPDLVLSDGSVAVLQRLANRGVAVVLCAALRFAYEGCIPELEKRGFLRHGEPMRISGRELMDIAVANLHSETLRFDIDARDFAEWPSAIYWRVSGKVMLVHSFSWAPLLVDYSQIDRHSIETFEKWTLDGDYIHANFGDNTRRVHVVSDSDEIALVSFTREAEHSFLPLQPKSVLGFPIVGYLLKLVFMRRFFHGDSIDPLKRRILPVAVRWHGGTQSRWSPLWLRTRLKSGFFVHCVAAKGRMWRKLDALADRLWDRHIAKYYYVADLAEETLADLLTNESTNASLRWRTFWLWLASRYPLSTSESRRLRLHGRVPARAENFTFLNQYGMNSHLVLRISPPVSAGRWYWEIHSPNIGAAGPAVTVTGSFGMTTARHSIVREIGDNGEGWGWRADGVKTGPAGSSSWGVPADRADEVIMIALDMDAGKLWFGRNGDWFEKGDPAGGVNPAFSDLRGLLYPAISALHGGAGSAVLMSRVEPGSWRYPAPSGFLALVEWTPRAISMETGEGQALVDFHIDDVAPEIRV